MFNQKRLTNWYSAGKKVAPYVVRGLKYYNQYKRAKTRTNQKRGTSGYGVTNQQDARVVYRKKTMPRRKRQRWKKFVKKVEAISDKGLGTKTRVFNTTLTNTNGTGGQSYMTFQLYGKFGADTPSSSGCLDLANMFGAYNTQSPFKLKFKSAVLDLTITNAGDINDAVGPPCEVDVFQVWYKADPKMDNPETAISRAEGRTNTIAGCSPLTLAQRGVQLFELPAAISMLNMKIIKKTKFFLPYLGTATYQLRDPRNRVANNEDITEGQPSPVPANSFVMPGWTQGVFVFWKPVAGFAATRVKLAVGASRKYNYRVDTDAFTEDGFS